jgi:hypothetical protein
MWKIIINGRRYSKYKIKYFKRGIGGINRCKGVICKLEFLETQFIYVKKVIKFIK